jgi:hypothetical protein
MSVIDIDRLALELPGATAEEGRRMAVDIVAALAAAGGLPAAGDYPTIRVTVPAAAHERAADLTARIVASAIRELRRGTG